MAVIPAAAGLVITGVFGLISVAQEVNKITEKKKPSNRLRKWSARYEVALLYAARFIPNMSGVEKDVYRVAYKYYEELMDMQGELDSGILTDAEARKKMDSKRDEYKQKLDMLKSTNRKMYLRQTSSQPATDSPSSKLALPTEGQHDVTRSKSKSKSSKSKSSRSRTHSKAPSVSSIVLTPAPSYSSTAVYPSPGGVERKKSSTATSTTGSSAYTTFTYSSTANAPSQDWSGKTLHAPMMVQETSRSRSVRKRHRKNSVASTASFHTLTSSEDDLPY